jgi:deoxyribonuclease-4
VRIGAHVRRRAGGAGSTVEEIRTRGGDCAQVFVSNPRGWAAPRVTDDDAEAFRASWEASGFGPLIAHAAYLINISSPNPDFLARSRSLARASLEACDVLGVEALVVHAGTGGGDDHDTVVARAAESLRAVADAGAARVLVELEEGIAAASASTIPEAHQLLEASGLPEIGLCLDTCHLFATGYELDGEAGAERLVAELRSTGLLDRVGLIHANDAAFECGSHRDRHENLGDGFIGLDGFRAMTSRPELAALPWILETPGDADRQAKDIATLRDLAAT